MSERVDLPADGGNVVGSELCQYELMAECGLIDHVHVVRPGLVMHAPAAVDELPLAGRYKLLHVGPHRVALLPPPALEEGLLDVDELALRIALQSGDGRGEDMLYGCVLDVLVRADVVLVDGLEPAHIVVRVGDEMDSECTAQRQQCSRAQQANTETT